MVGEQGLIFFKNSFQGVVISKVYSIFAALNKQGKKYCYETHISAK